MSCGLTGRLFSHSNLGCLYLNYSWILYNVLKFHRSYITWAAECDRVWIHIAIAVTLHISQMSVSNMQVLNHGTGEFIFS